MRVAGDWCVRAGGESYELTLRQKMQKLDGFMVIARDRTGLSEPRLLGYDIRFSVNGRAGVRYEFTGKA